MTEGWKGDHFVCRRRAKPITARPVRDQVMELRKAAWAGLTADQAASTTRLPLDRVLVIGEAFGIPLRGLAG